MRFRGGNFVEMRGREMRGRGEDDLITKFMMIRDLNNSILKVKVDKDTIMKVSAEVITMEAIRADLLDMTTKVKDFIHSLEVVVDTNEEDQ